MKQCLQCVKTKNGRSEIQRYREEERWRKGGSGTRKRDKETGQGNGTRSKKQRKVKPAGYEGRRKDEITGGRGTGG